MPLAQQLRHGTREHPNHRRQSPAQDQIMQTRPIHPITPNVHKQSTPTVRFGFLIAILSIAVPGCDLGNASSLNNQPNAKHAKLLNVSYDPTREFYVEFNQTFAEHWRKTTGELVEIDQSHGGSGKQARAVTEGLQADVVSLALAGDIDTIAKQSGLVASDWQSKLPYNSSPYTSTVVFLVRKGNPKNIHDWDDLVREGVEVITPNPKTGGGARWNYLAAWGFALHQRLGSLSQLKNPDRRADIEAANEHARNFIAELYRHVPVLDSAARAATNTFVQRQIGDVLLTWENEAMLAIRELGNDQVQLVVPSISILAEPPVAVISKNTESHGTSEVAVKYLEYLYSDEGQRLAAKHFYRPRSTIAGELATPFAELKLFALMDILSGWEEAHEVHFKDRTGVFDRIYQSSNSH
jgi:sulfate/thiosulfate transport system substrate-binding protein